MCKSICRAIQSVLLALMLFASGLHGSTRELTVIHTTDTHGRIYGASHGWLKMSSAINHEIAASGGHANCLVLDCGDLAQGTPESAFSGGAIMVKILNHLNYDAWIPGNHDFDFGLEMLNRNLEHFNGTALAANVEAPLLAAKLKAWRIFEKNGIKLAVIGITSPHLTSYIWAPVSGTLTVDGIEKALGKIIAAVRLARPDIILLAVHHGQYSKDLTLYDLSSKYPEIDLILGGHTHQSIPGEKLGASCWFAQAGHADAYFGKIKIAWDDRLRKIIRITSTLEPVKPETPDDTELRAVINDDLRAADAHYAPPFSGRAERLRELAGLLANEPGAVIARAMAESSSAPIALYAHSRRPIKPEFGLTRKTIFYLLPYEDLVCTLSLDVDEFKTVLHEQFTQLKKYKAAPSLSGVSADIIHKTGAVKELRLPDGKIWNGKKKLRIAFSSFSLAGGGGAFPQLRTLAADRQNLPENTGVLVRDCTTKYIEQFARQKSK